MNKTVLTIALLATTGLLVAGIVVFAPPTGSSRVADSAKPGATTVRTVTLSVPGMNCSACPITVKAALMKVEGVERAEVSYEKREAVVTYDSGKTTVQTLTETTNKAGYPSTVKNEPSKPLKQ